VLGGKVEHEADITAGSCKDGRFVLAGDLNGLKEPKRMKGHLGVCTARFGTP